MPSPELEPDDDDLTSFLNQLGQGRTPGESALLPAIYRELRGLAHSQMIGERPDHTLSTTALVHEAWLRIVEKGDARWANRNHFFAVAAEAMRHILVDYARRRQAAKRGSSARRVEFTDSMAISEGALDNILVIDQALSRLRKEDERQAKVVTLHFFAGLNYAQIAEILEVNERTVKRDWQFAQAWLFGELGGKAEPQS